MRTPPKKYVEDNFLSLDGGIVKGDLVIAPCEREPPASLKRAVG